MPAGAFGDSISGVALAGGISAALVRKARTGEPSVVDGSLLGTAMWAMQMGIVGAAVAQASPAGPAAAAPTVANPLVSNYKTSDGRWVALCMLQRDLYWDGLFEAIGRADLLSDPRFTTPEDRTANGTEVVAELVKTFETETLAHWREVLSHQRGQWDVVRLVSEVGDDPQAVVNGFIQRVDYGQGRALPIVANPVQFDRTPPEIRPAPEFAADTDRILEALGMDEAAIIDAKVSGGVV